MLNVKFLRRRQTGFVSIATASLTGLVAVFGVPGTPAEAAEDAKGFYLLGSNASLAGTTPPPGTYVVDYKYFYTGDASGNAAASITLERPGIDVDLEADINVDANIFIDILTPLWVAPQKVLNGSLGFGLLIPVGYQDISADLNVTGTVTLPDGTELSGGRRFQVDDDTFNFGDPVLMAFLGWNEGNWHWKVTGLLNVPIGAYDEEDIANMGFNRWAFDASAAMTWLDPKIGFEVSAVAGFTFNGENPDTDYKTGTEFHLEGALIQHFSKAFSAGLVGYYYDQVTGDSGAGATLGDFEGRAVALGPAVNYNLQIGQLPVATSLRWYHEFDVENRLEGDAVYFQATMPLVFPGR